MTVGILMKRYPRTVSIIRFILFFSVAILLLYLVFRGVSFREVIDKVLHADPLWVGLSFVLSFIALVIRALRWQMLVHSAGYTCSFRNAFFAMMVGYAANLVFPRLGEISRSGTLAKTEKMPFSAVLGTVVVERIVDVISLAGCILVALVFESARLGDFMVERVVAPVVDRVAAIDPVIAIVALLVVIILLAYIFMVLRKRQVWKNIALVISNFLSGIRSVSRLSRPWMFVFHSVVIWILYYFSILVCFPALSETAGLGWGAALLLLVAGGIGMSAPVQGGIGAYHLLVAQGLVLYGISKTDGLAFATLVHTTQLLLIIVTTLGSAVLQLMFRRRDAAEIPGGSIEEKAEQ
ncbi:MAG TPA: lysylphosphatidylglycerol synthase transmembrane domain-containing protein [Flavisolibacter sp.]